MLCLSRHSSVAECYVGVVATQLMDASPEVGVGEMSTGETPQGAANHNLPENERGNDGWENHHFYFRRLHLFSWLVFHCHVSFLRGV